MLFEVVDVRGALGRLGAREEGWGWGSSQARAGSQLDPTRRSGA